eukprot:460594-Pelagomonas_calceolata.AAC.2
MVAAEQVAIPTAAYSFSRQQGQAPPTACSQAPPLPLQSLPSSRPCPAPPPCCLLQHPLLHFGTLGCPRCQQHHCWTLAEARAVWEAWVGVLQQGTPLHEAAHAQLACGARGRQH